MKTLWYILLLAASLAQSQTPESMAVRTSLPTSHQGQAASTEQIVQDWPNLGRYREENAKLPPPLPGENRVVFIGDSIIGAWDLAKFFPDKPYINRGIGGQTTPQMLLRLRPDVIALKPRVVVILAGTNDIAGNTGPSSPEMIEDNLESMADLASFNGIRVVLSSILPVTKYLWKPEIDPAQEIRLLNDWMRRYSAKRGYIYLDYYSSMVNTQYEIKSDFTIDGVHPSSKGYEIMTALADKAITEALQRKPATIVQNNFR